MAETPRRTTICGITINSDNEFKAMARALGQSADAIELVNYHFNSDGMVQFDPNQWMENTCQKQVKCDIVVLSGHFGGIFGHETLPIMLPLDVLEKASCSNRCPGIFQDAKEVYLLGCQSLAHNDHHGNSLKSLESPQQLLGPISLFTHVKPTHLERMRRIFPNAGRIFGYRDAGPLGPQIESAFFHATVRQKDYLSSLANASSVTPGRNNLGIGILDFTYGAAFSENLHSENQLFCKANYSDDADIKLVSHFRLLMQANGMKYLKGVLNDFTSGNFSTDQLQLMAERNRGALFTRLVDWTGRQQPYATRIMSAELLRLLNWNTTLQWQEHVQQLIRDAENNPGDAYASASAICYGAEVTEPIAHHLSPGHFKDSSSVLAMQLVDCIRPENPAWIRILSEIKESHPQDFIRNLASRTLRRLKGP